MTIQHTVTQGEHLSRIAKRYGFSDHRTIWDHARNAALKQEHQNPNVLFPGDQLFIPDREQKIEAGPRSPGPAALQPDHAAAIGQPPPRPGAPPRPRPTLSPTPADSRRP